MQALQYVGDEGRISRRGCADAVTSRDESIDDMSVSVVQQVMRRCTLVPHPPPTAGALNGAATRTDSVC